MDESGVGLRPPATLGQDSKECVRLGFALEPECRRCIHQGFDTRCVPLIKAQLHYGGQACTAMGGPAGGGIRTAPLTSSARAPGGIAS